MLAPRLEPEDEEGGASRRRPRSSARARATARRTATRRRRRRRRREQRARAIVRRPSAAQRPPTGSIVGLGNPGPQYERTPHNVGFEVVAELARRWDLPKPKKKFGGLLSDGRTGPGGPRVAVLQPQTYMNDSGAAPARRAARSRSTSTACSSCTTRSTCRSATSGRGSAAGSPATTASSRCGPGSARPTSRACASASAAPTRPTRRSSRRTCSAAGGSRAAEVERLVGRAADVVERVVAGVLELAARMTARALPHTLVRDNVQAWRSRENGTDPPTTAYRRRWRRWGSRCWRGSTCAETRPSSMRAAARAG